MFCPQCGSQLPDGTKFCGNCGFDLSAAQSTNGQQHHSTSSSAYAQAQGSVYPQPAGMQQPAPQQTPADPYSAQYAQPQYAQPPAAGEQPYGNQQYAQGQPAASQQQAPSGSFGLPMPGPGGPQQSYGTPGQQPYGAPQQQYGSAPASNPYPIPGMFKNVVIPKGMPPVGEFFQSPVDAIVKYAEGQNLGMKWYRAITVALLYLSGLVFLGNAFQSFTGSAYQGYADLLYNMYPAMRVLDIVNGICYIAFALMMLYCRMLLAQFKRGAVETYFAFSLVQVAVELVYSLLSVIVLGAGWAELGGTLIGAIVGLGVQYAIIRTYFGKRAHLFVS